MWKDIKSVGGSEINKKNERGRWRWRKLWETFAFCINLPFKAKVTTSKDKSIIQPPKETTTTNM